MLRLKHWWNVILVQFIFLIIYIIILYCKVFVYFERWVWRVSQARLFIVLGLVSMVLFFLYIDVARGNTIHWSQGPLVSNQWWLYRLSIWYAHTKKKCYLHAAYENSIISFNHQWHHCTHRTTRLDLPFFKLPSLTGCHWKKGTN